MKKIYLLSLIAVLYVSIGYSQVGIGTTEPHASAVLDVSSSTKGFLPPRFLMSEIATLKAVTGAGAPAEGLVVYCKDCTDCGGGGGLYVFNGTDFIPQCGGGGGATGGGGTGGTAIPGGVTLGINQMYIMTSVLDANYLSYSAPTGTASATPGTTTGGDTLIDYTGVIDATTGVAIQIPVDADDLPIGTGVILAAYSNTQIVPSALTKNGVATSVTLSWPAQAVSEHINFINATIKATSTDLNAVQLDLNNGLGANNLGIELASFVYPINAAGTTATLSLRVTPGIPDRNFGNGTGHDFIYSPIVGNNGRVWLNNNLGANYAKMGHAAFSPSTQAKSHTDQDAAGSLFQWGRRADGHEIINRTSATLLSTTAYQTLALGAGSSPTVNGTSPTITPSTSNFLASTGGTTSWYGTAGAAATTDFRNLWLNNSAPTVEVYTDANPCPAGYAVPAEFTLRDEKNAWRELQTPNTGSPSLDDALVSNLKMPLLTGNRYGTQLQNSETSATFTQDGSTTHYWTGEAGVSRIGRAAEFTTKNGFPLRNYDSRYGAPVRCVKLP